MAQILVSKLRAISIISDRGLQIGRLKDILFDEKNGEIESLVVRPISRETLGRLPKDPSGNNVLVPFSAVMSVRDFIVVNERALAIQRMKVGPKEGT